MPRTKKLGARAKVVYARNKGKFSTCDAKPKQGVSSNVCPSPISNTGVRNIIEPDFGVRFADPMAHERIEESRCYYCGSEEDCDLCMQIHYNLCVQCRNSDPTQGWWEDPPTQIHTTTYAVSDDGSFGDDDVFHTGGSAVQDTITGTNVLEKLMSNGSRTKPAKRARGKVSVSNPTALWKDKSQAMQRYASAERAKDYRRRQKTQKLLTAAHDILMAKITAFFSQPSTSLVTTDEEAIDVILDEALAAFDTVLISTGKSAHQIVTA
jgi:hypothetical protein